MLFIQRAVLVLEANTPKFLSNFWLQILFLSLMQVTVQSQSYILLRLNVVRFYCCFRISCWSLLRESSEGLVIPPFICSQQAAQSFWMPAHRLWQALQYAYSPQTFQPKFSLIFSYSYFLRAFLLRYSLSLLTPFAYSSCSASVRFFQYSFFFSILEKLTSFSLFSSQSAALLLATCASLIFSFNSRYLFTVYSLSFPLRFSAISALSWACCEITGSSSRSCSCSFSYSSWPSLLSKSAKFLSQTSNLFLQLQASLGSSPSDSNFLMACWSLMILSLASLICWKTSFLKGSYLKNPRKSSISPQSMMTIGQRGLSSLSMGTFEIFLTISIPSITCPKTTCLPSRCGQALSVMKN